MRLIRHLEYDRKAHAFVVIARTEHDHTALASHVNQTEQLAKRLRVLSKQSAVARLCARMAETRGPERLPAYRAIWRADQRSARLLARELTDPAIKYFVATASTPPDRAVIKAVAENPDLLNDLRAEATLRWLGLDAGLRGAKLLEAFDGLRANPDAPNAAVLTAALQTWVACAPHSAKALILLGQYGDGRHLAAISAQQDGPHSKAVQAALKSLRARFEGMGTGNLALSAEASGHLAITDEPTPG